MQCDLCGKAFGSSTPCHCIVCARTALYPLRIEQASALLEKETLGKHVEAIVREPSGSSSLKGSGISISQTITLGGSTGGMLIDQNQCAKRTEFDRIQSDIDETTARIESITQKADLLRKEIEKAKKLRATQVAANHQKRSDMNSATHTLDGRRDKELDKMSKAAERASYRSDRLHNEIVTSRLYLCRQAAVLSGLRYKQRKMKDGTMRDIYYIGFNRIFDLRDLCSKVICRHLSIHVLIQ
jgi:hypothetical protein